MRRSNRFAMSQLLPGALVTSRPAYEVSVGPGPWPWLPVATWLHSPSWGNGEAVT